MGSFEIKDIGSIHNAIDADKGWDQQQVQDLVDGTQALIRLARLMQPQTAVSALTSALAAVIVEGALPGKHMTVCENVINALRQTVMLTGEASNKIAA